MTEKIYYNDSFKSEFDAKVLSCKPVNDKYEIVLDRTCFYPEGGGQPSDTGIINNAYISYVFEKESLIVHVSDKPFDIGITVNGKIDWSQRFSRMQHHTGEHIVSGIVHKKLGLENVGFHMGKEYVTMDFNGIISQEDLDIIENEANKAVYENIDVVSCFIEKSGLALIDYRSKKEIDGDVRIVKIKGVDTCACCATHVKKTGQIGIIKIIGKQNYKGGTRVSMLAAEKALKYINIMQKNVFQISSMLSSETAFISEAVNNILKDREKLKLKNIELKNRLLNYIAKDTDKNSDNIYFFEKELDGNEINKLCMLLSRDRNGISIVFSGDDENGYKYAAYSEKCDIKLFGRALNEALNGKGGGKGNIIQGSLKADENKIKDYLNNLWS